MLDLKTRWRKNDQPDVFLSDQLTANNCKWAALEPLPCHTHTHTHTHTRGRVWIPLSLPIIHYSSGCHCRLWGPRIMGALRKGQVERETSWTHTPTHTHTHTHTHPHTHTHTHKLSSNQPCTKMYWSQSPPLLLFSPLFSPSLSPSPLHFPPHSPSLSPPLSSLSLPPPPSLISLPRPVSDLLSPSYCI